MPATKPRNVVTKSLSILGIATAIWLIWYCALAIALGAAEREAPELSYGAVQAGHLQLASTGDRTDLLRARFEQLSEHDMKAFYARCSEEGMARRLDGGEAMACSVGYDVLLKKHFAGDFQRLLQWSRRTSYPSAR